MSSNKTKKECSTCLGTVFKKLSDNYQCQFCGAIIDGKRKAKQP